MFYAIERFRCYNYGVSIMGPCFTIRLFFIVLLMLDFVEDYNLLLSKWRIIYCDVSSDNIPYAEWVQEINVLHIIVTQD